MHARKKPTARRLGILVVISLAALMMLMMSGTALANFGPHGAFGTVTDADGDGIINLELGDSVNPDTDACAGCHRAHTAVSGITWEDSDGDTKSALLIGTTSSSMQEFCYTCHSDAGAGAATNVQAGMYDAGKVDQSQPGYGTVESAPGMTLNGGGFDSMNGMSVTSTHMVNGADWVAWGGGDGTSFTGGTSITMDCASCHDPHGSSNYRLLKDTVNGVRVGGYAGGVDSGIDPTPEPFVVSNEVGYPEGGFRLHRNYGDLDNDGVSGPGDYQPDYTFARYAQAPDTDTVAGPDPDKGMSAWCAACHTQYNTTSSLGQGAFDAADGYGLVTRHRHPVNVPLTAFKGDRSLMVFTDPFGLNAAWGDFIDIPLEHAATELEGTLQTNTTGDFIGCLTCHRAHGTDATMSGYASSPSALNPTQVDPLTGELLTGGGVPPAASSALLRANNRGVCERCHNK